MNKEEKTLTKDEIAEEITLLDIESGYISASDFTDEKQNYLAFLNDGDFSKFRQYVQDELKQDDLNTSLHIQRFNNILKSLDALEKNSIFYKLGSLQNPLYYKSRPMFEEYEGKEGMVNLNDFLLYYEEGKALVGNTGELNTHLKDINEALEKSNLKPIYFYTGSRREKEFINIDISFSDFADLNSKEYLKQKQKSNEEEM